MSLTSVDLPEPDTPVTQVNTPSGISTSTFFRLCSRAPRRLSDPRAGGARFAAPRSRAPERNAR
jgi:hypothetical protein